MSLENATRLLQAVLTDATMRDRFAAVDEAGLAAASAEVGLPCTASELEQVVASLTAAAEATEADGSLTDSALEGIAGGAGYSNGQQLAPQGFFGNLLGHYGGPIGGMHGIPLGSTIGGSVGGVMGRLLPFSADPAWPPKQD